MYVIKQSFKDWYINSRKKSFKAKVDYVYYAAKLYVKGIERRAPANFASKCKIYINPGSLKHSIIAAVDDLERLKKYHNEISPNSIKEAAFIAYWLMRFKPLFVRFKDDAIKNALSNELKDELLLINECLCVKLLICAAFPGKVKKTNIHEKSREHGEKQLTVLEKYLRYVLAYREYNPKTLEAILMAATIQPVFEVDENIWSNLA